MRPAAVPLALACLALYTLACRSASPPAPSAQPDPRAWLREVEALRVAARIPGLAVAVVQDGRVVLAEGLGVADIATQAPVTAETPFDIASVSKPISAVVALRLVELGQLDLDRPMASFAGFAEFCGAVREAGGIFWGDYRCDTEPLTLRHVLSMQANDTVGTRFYYNPPSYSWASRPMMEVTQKSFSDLVAEHVFGPAAMTGSARKHRNLPLRPELAERLARPHRLDAQGQLVASELPGPQGDGAAGGVTSTAADLARFDLALDAGKLLSPASRAALWQTRTGADGQPLPYGLGWFVRTLDGRRVVWHTGLWEQAYSALYLKLPDEGLSLILLANSDGLGWQQGLDEAALERSPFARSFLAWFSASRQRAP
jgi:CubicO group peptidase (beta-lactamase class C family)